MKIKKPTPKPIILVIDGQGGGIGAAIIKQLKEALGEAVEIWALGTNSIATSNMMKAKANRGATGENAVRVSVLKADVIVGPIAISWPDSMMGEITASISQAIMDARAYKVLVPLSQENVFLAGFYSEPLPHLIAEAVKKVLQLANNNL